MITIITSTGGIYGTGHASRMAFLAEFLADKGHQVSVVCPVHAGQTVPALKPFIRTAIPAGTKIIIRDMRDSTADEIRLLQEKAFVISVDDCGEGRTSAGMIIDCLPNLLDLSPLPPLEKSPFLFGHSFVKHLKENRDRTFIKDIDICVYAGQNPDEEYLAKLLSAVPPEKSICITGQGNPRLKKDSYGISAPQSFTETLLRSRALVSHFGVTLFEARLCGCALYTVNPTQYHHDLCERARELLPLVNFGTIDAFSAAKAKQTLESSGQGGQISASSVLETIGQCADRFYQAIKPLL